ncbi:CBS domain-containing protein [Streptomyces sp. NPDC048438]|uniref:CBS domain-containing protein n=1 Tax=Streptomyces sp. NPDC048438 TaxID=3365551 RepID=UPI0037168F84
MTLVQVQPGPVSAAAVRRTVADVMETAGPQVCDDMTVEVALAVMTSARTGHLLVCDDSGLCVGLVAQAQLTAAQGSYASSDMVQLRDIVGHRGPVTSPVTTMAEAARMMRNSHVNALPVVDEHGSALGVLTLAH